MTLVKFSSVITLSTTRTPDPASAGIDRFVGLEHIEPENLHIRRWGLVADGTTFTSTFKRGQVLFGKRRAYQRKVAVADFDGVCSSDIYVFESKDPNVLLPELVPFICQSEGFYDYAVKTSAGSLSPRTNWSHLANYEFPLPPVDEQRRIAHLLWAADDVIQLQNEAYEKLLVVKQATIDTLFTKGVNGKHKKFQTTKLGEIPENWNLEKLEDVTTKIVDGVHKRPDYVEVGIPFVTVENLSQSREIDLANARRITQKDHDEFFKRCNPEKGDVLVTKDGTLGIAKLVKTDEIFGVFVSVALLKPNRSKLDGRYLKAFFDSSIFKSRLSGKTSGSALKHIHLIDFRSTLLPLPDLQEQEEIVEVLDEIDNQVDLSFAHIENCINLKKALLSNSIG